MTKLGVLASGRGSNFQAIIDAIDAGKINAKVALLVADKKDSYAIERAKKHRIPYVYIPAKDFPTKDEFFLKIVEELKAKEVELVVLAGFMRIVRKPLLDAFPMAVMNIHPAILPSFPGLHGQAQAVDCGVKVSGCTVHFVDEGMDTGPVIIQAVVPVLDADTEETLSARILKLEHKIFPEAIKLYAEGRLEVVGRKVRVKPRKGSGSLDEDAFIVNPPIR